MNRLAGPAVIGSGRTALIAKSAAAPLAARRYQGMQKRITVPADCRTDQTNMPSDEYIRTPGSTLGKGRLPSAITADKAFPVDRDVFFACCGLGFASLLMLATQWRDYQLGNDERRAKMAEYVAAAAILRAAGGAPDATTYGAGASGAADEKVVAETVKVVERDISHALALIVCPAVLPQEERPPENALELIAADIMAGGAPLADEARPV